MIPKTSGYGILMSHQEIVKEKQHLSQGRHEVKEATRSVMTNEGKTNPQTSAVIIISYKGFFLLEFNNTCPTCHHALSVLWAESE